MIVRMSLSAIVRNGVLVNISVGVSVGLSMR